MIGLVVFVYGLVFGSFFNVVGLRVPMKESIVTPPSHCTNCQTRLRAFDLLPVLSYCLQSGKCRYCKVSISPIYPIFELLTGILYLIGYLNYGLSSTFVLYLLFVSLLVIISVSDYTYQLIPDKVLAFFLVAFLIFQAIFKPVSWEISILGFLISFSVLYFIAVVTNGGMGGGDIKLFAVLGIVLGYKGFIVTFLIACLFGACYGIIVKRKKNSKQTAIAFGPFIAIGAFVAFIWQEPIIEWYVNLFF